MILFLATIFALIAAPANAGPVGAAIAMIGQFAAASALNAFIVNVAMNVGLSVLAGAIAKKQKNDGSGGGIRQDIPTMGDRTPASFMLGKYATPGNRTCPPYTHGRQGDTPNAFLTEVYDLGDLPITSLDGVYCGDEKLTLGAPLAPGAWFPGFSPVTEGKYAGLIWVKFHDGNQTSAEQHLINCSVGSKRPWSSDMVGRGVPYVITISLYDAEKWSGFPEFLFETSGVKLYNPARDTSVGGAGAQRWANPATWEFTENPVVVAYNINRGINFPGGFRWGGRCDESDLPLANWIASINKAAVARPDGLPTYRVGYEIKVGPEEYGGDEPASVIEELMASASGSVCEYGGTWAVRIGAPELPVKAFTDDDIIITQGQTFDPFPSIDETINGVSSQYPEPAERWVSKQAPTRYSPTYEASDQGRRLLASLPLPMVWDIKQVQELMQTMLDDSRHFRTHEITLPPDYAHLMPLDVIMWTSVRNGYENKLFEIVNKRENLKTLNCRFVIRERDPSDYDFPISKLLPSAVNPIGGDTIGTQEGVPGILFEPFVIDDNSGRPRRPAALATWTIDRKADYDGIAFQIRPLGQPAIVSYETTQEIMTGKKVISQGIVSNTVYQGRAKMLAKRATVWGDWQTFTSPNVLLGILDIDWEALEAEMTGIADELQAWLDETRNVTIPQILADVDRLTAENSNLATAANQIAADLIAETEARQLETGQAFDAALANAQGLRATADEIAAVRDWAANLDYANYQERLELRRSLSKTIGDNAAFFDERINVAVSATGSIAEQLTTLEAKNASVQSQVLSVQTALAEGDNALAQQIAMLSVGSADQFDAAKIFHFGTGVEGWIRHGGTDPTYEPGGYLRPGDAGNIKSPPGLNIPANEYRQLRFRVEKRGAPVWSAAFMWRSESEAFETIVKNLVIPEPNWVDGVGLVTLNVPWETSVTIDQIVLRTTAPTPEDYLLFDWIAVGRPSPGASTADILSERRARISADEALAEDILSVLSTINDPATGLTGTASALAALTTRVQTAEGSLTATGQAVTAVEAALGGKASVTALDSLRVEVEAITGASGGLTESFRAVGEAISGIRAAIPPLAAEVLEQGFADFLGGAVNREAIASAVERMDIEINRTNDALDITANAVTTIEAKLPGFAGAAAVNSLQSKLNVTDGKIDAQASDIRKLNAFITGASDATALDALIVRVTQSESEIVTLAQRITQLTANLDGKASAQSVSDLLSQVTANDGDITALSQSLTALSATVNGKASTSSVTSLTSRVTATESGISTINSAITSLTATVNGKANSSVVTALESRINHSTTGLSAINTAVTALKTQMAGKANVSSLDFLSTRIDNTQAGLTATADRVTAVNADVAGMSAGGLFRVYATANTAGSVSRIALSASASANGANNAASIFIEATGAGRSVVVIDAERFILATGYGTTNRRAPFFVQNNIVYINRAMIRDADILRAHIGQLQVDTLHLAAGAVTTSSVASIAGYTVGGAANFENRLICELNVYSPEAGADLIVTMFGRQSSGMVQLPNGNQNTTSTSYLQFNGATTHFAKVETVAYTRSTVSNTQLRDYAFVRQDVCVVRRYKTRAGNNTLQLYLNASGGSVLDGVLLAQQFKK